MKKLLEILFLVFKRLPAKTQEQIEKEKANFGAMLALLNL